MIFDFDFDTIALSVVIAQSLVVSEVDIFHLLVEIDVCDLVEGWLAILGHDHRIDKLSFDEISSLIFFFAL